MNDEWLAFEKSWHRPKAGRTEPRSALFGARQDKPSEYLTSAPPRDLGFAQERIDRQVVEELPFYLMQGPSLFNE